MANYRIRLSEVQVDQLGLICDAGPEKISAALDVLDKQQPTIKAAKIKQAVSSVLGIDTGTVFARFTRNLAVSIRRTLSTAQEAINNISEQESEFNWSKDRYAIWHACKPLLVRALGTHSIILAAKATDLAFDFDNLFLNARVLTDARPVFDDSRTQILGASITQTLRLEWYAPDGERHAMSLAMDTKDIERLSSCCEQASKKAVVARRMLEDKGKIETVFANEDDDEYG